MIRAGAILCALLLAACSGGDPTAPASPNANEDALLFGVRRDAAVDCQPERDGLPDGATAAVTCQPANGFVTRLTLVRWDSEDRMMNAYFGALAENGVTPRSGDCAEGEGEAGYMPGDDASLALHDRQGCFRTGGEVVMLVTYPPDVLAEVHGGGESVDSLPGWVWLGNQDVPGAPTIWNEDGPINIEKG